MFRLRPTESLPRPRSEPDGAIPSAPLRRSSRPDLAVHQNFVSNWTTALEGAGVVRRIETVTGPTVVIPKVVNVSFGPPTTLTVKMPAGMIPSDITREAARIAPHLGVWGLRVEDNGCYAKVTLLQSDPLTQNLSLAPVDGILLGRTESGELWIEDDFPHVIVQGMTRSGKSSWLYSVLAQWAGRTSAVPMADGLSLPGEVRGVDPSGITLRPFDDVILGLGSPGQIEAYLTGLVAEMDSRLKSMPPRCDVLPIEPSLIILEEYPAVLRAVDAHDTKLGKRIRGLVTRLLAEGHKVGYRVIIVCQRAEATIVGGAERSQCAGRVSFRVDSVDSLKLLHHDPSISDTPDGVALVTWPGRETRRIRAPRIPTYGEYVDLIPISRRTTR